MVLCIEQRPFCKPLLRISKQAWVKRPDTVRTPPVNRRCTASKDGFLNCTATSVHFRNGLKVQDILKIHYSYQNQTKLETHTHMTLLKYHPAWSFIVVLIAH